MCQYLPLLLSKTFLSYVLFGELSISDPSILIQSFMQYISADERRILEKSLSGDLDSENEDEFKELLDVLKMYDCRSRHSRKYLKSYPRNSTQRNYPKAILCHRLLERYCPNPYRNFSHSKFPNRYVCVGETICYQDYKMYSVISTVRCRKRVFRVPPTISLIFNL